MKAAAHRAKPCIFPSRSGGEAQKAAAGFSVAHKVMLELLIQRTQ